MARVALYIADPVNRMTLKAMLEAAGHRVGEHDPQAAVADEAERAVACASVCPAILLTTISGVPDAIKAMRNGVYAYILLPFQPGEAPLMVERAVADAGNGVASARSEGDADWPSLEAVERQHIRETLRRCKHNQARAARVLGIGRNTLWRKLKRISAEEDVK